MKNDRYLNDPSSHGMKFIHLSVRNWIMTFSLGVAQNREIQSIFCAFLEMGKTFY